MGENLIQENPARSKQGRGIDAGDKWKDVQTSTFMNWVNLQLQHRDLSISDLGVDFNNGVKLCALIEVLQNKPIRGRIVKEPKNSHQSLQNATVALTAVANDNIRLVNIGKCCRVFKYYVKFCNENIVTESIIRMFKLGVHG
ncbi:hypothetical protein SNE40_000960 [Patella caerulea]|uniref:Calponin-homology (CH) domain-containing protein n=1 Tax=Patella caerulea TaxID=87958 RepID=A0AAN8Q7N5_PATCE